MTATNGDPSRSRKRRWRLVHLCVWLLVLLWLGPFAYVRITTPPAAQARSTKQASSIDGQSDDELYEAVIKLPPPPVTITHPSPAWLWRFNNNVLAAGLCGAWSPDPNSAQDKALTYITDSKNRRLLDRIVALADERRGQPEDALSSPPANHQLLQMRGDEYVTAASALAFRARYLADAKEDLPGALASLRAAAETAYRSPVRDVWGYNSGVQIGIVNHYELGCLLQEVDVPPNLARDTIDFLRQELSLSIADAAIRVAQGDSQLDRLLDRYYTNDGSGDGWLVLSAASDQFRNFGFGTPQPTRSRLWNVFSPLFYGRSTVRAKLLGLSDDLRKLDDLDYDAGSRLLANRVSAQQGGGVLDGPLVYRTRGINEYTFATIVGDVARRRALVVMLALSAYKYDHGAYPAALDALTPEYLLELPLDAFTRAPFHYEKVSDTAFELGPTSDLSVQIHQGWWMDDLGYRPDSYVPKRNVEKP